MKAVVIHIWLLFTLRHSGEGLPRTVWPLLTVILAASLLASARWRVLYETFMFASAIELFVIGLAMFFWLIMVAYISPGFSAAFALVSMGADTATIVLAATGFFGDYARTAILFLQSIALARIATVLYMKSDHPRRG